MNENNFYFEVNGLRLRLEVNERGFCLWDEIGHQWVLDASTIGYTGGFLIANNEPLTDAQVQEDEELTREGERSFEIVRKWVAS